MTMWSFISVQCHFYSHSLNRTFRRLSFEAWVATKKIFLKQRILKRSPNRTNSIRDVMQIKWIPMESTSNRAIEIRECYYYLLNNEYEWELFDQRLLEHNSFNHNSNTFIQISLPNFMATRIFIQNQCSISFNLCQICRTQNQLIQTYLPPKFGLRRISYPSSICVKVFVMFSNCAAVKALWSHLTTNYVWKERVCSLTHGTK